MIQLTLTVKMTTAQVVKTSGTVNNNGPIEDYVHPDDQTQPFFLLMSSLILYISFIMWASFRCQNIIFKFFFYTLQVEQFKKNQLGHHSLHVKFNVNTGDPVASDSDWAHLQV